MEGATPIAQRTQVGIWVLASVPGQDGEGHQGAACLVVGTERRPLPGTRLNVEYVRLRLPDGGKVWLPQGRVMRQVPQPSRPEVRPPWTGAQITAQVAEREAQTLGYKPLVPYPDRARLPWDVECVRCGWVRRTSLTRLRREGACRHVMAPVAEPEAEAEAAGYKPLVPYPGRAGLPWDVECVRCGRPRRTSLSRLRHEGACRHWGRKIPASR